MLRNMSFERRMRYIVRTRALLGRTSVVAALMRVVQRWCQHEVDLIVRYLDERDDVQYMTICTFCSYVETVDDDDDDDE
jgi:hypothetical protein